MKFYTFKSFQDLNNKGKFQTLRVQLIISLCEGGEKKKQEVVSVVAHMASEILLGIPIPQTIVKCEGKDWLSVSKRPISSH